MQVKRFATLGVCAAATVGAAVAVLLVLGEFTAHESQAIVSPFNPGQVLYGVTEYAITDVKTGQVDVKTEESWTLIGPSGAISKMRVFLKDSAGKTLQDGYTDSQAGQVGTFFSPGQPLGGTTLRGEQSRDISAIAWNPAAIEELLLAKGFSRAEKSVVAGQPAEAYERSIPFVFDGGGEDVTLSDFPFLAQFAGPTKIVSRVFVGVDPPGLDLGEETIYRDSNGAEYMSLARRVVAFEVIDQAAVPPAIFDWPYKR